MMSRLAPFFPVPYFFCLPKIGLDLYLPSSRRPLHFRASETEPALRASSYFPGRRFTPLLSLDLAVIHPRGSISNRGGTVGC
jgi:hypothetical protein